MAFVCQELKIHDGHFYMPHPCRPNKKIFITMDVPHLLKLLRNRILDEVLVTKINGHVVTLQREDFEMIMDTDASGGEFRKVHKLKPLHINCQANERQRVYLACQGGYDKNRYRCYLVFFSVRKLN